MRSKKFFLILLFACVLVVNADDDKSDEDSGEYDEVDCCTLGNDWVYANCVAEPDDDMTDTCLKEATDCCQKVLEQNRHKCEENIKLAMEDKECNDTAEDSCCQNCKVGILLGISGTERSCGVPDNSTMYQCCRRSVEMQETTTEAVKTTPKPKQPPTTIPTTIPTTTPKTEPTTTPKAVDNRRQYVVELNPCEMEGDEICAHKCEPNGNSYVCICRSGFRLHSDKHSCIIMESTRCRRKNPCQHKCMDTGDAVICSCRKGFELMADNVSCIDVDECELKIHTCKPGMKCVNTAGSYRCAPDRNAPPRPRPEDRNMDHGSKASRGGCPEGFMMNKTNQVCDDVNECQRNPCPPGRVCVNTVGSFTCASSASNEPEPTVYSPPSEDSCPPGFEYDQTMEDCKDIDECLTLTDDCNRKSQFCLNTQGSFACQDKASKTSCPPGFKMRSDSTCEDIDECVENPDICPPDTVCVNDPGGYDCKTKPYGKAPVAPKPQPPQLPRFTPIPRPEPPRPSPYKPATHGSPGHPPCPRGYKKPPNGGCVDIDECRENTHDCDDFQNCLNTLGSYRCNCKAGFVKDPVTLACIDINECQKDDMNDCSETQRCDNTIGSYQCIRYMSCGTGYTLNAATSNCEDDDECTLETHGCAGLGPAYECVNLPGTYRCVKKKATTPATPEYYSGEYYEFDEEKPNSPDPPRIDERFSNNNEITNPRPTPERNTPNNDLSPTIASHYEPDRHTPRRPEQDPRRTQPDPRRPEPEPTRITPDTQRTEPDPRRTHPDHRVNPPRTYPRPADYDPNASYPSQEPTHSRPSIPRIENLPAPKPVDGTRPTIVGNPDDDDGNFVVDVDKIPKNTWTHLVPGEKYCIDGYTMDSRRQCIDINECDTGRYSCKLKVEVCRNTPGGYDCDCATGYSKKSKTSTCTLDEESSPPQPPVPRWNPRPTKSCDIGFQINQNTGECEDIDECADGTSRCASVGEICVNSMGGFRCQCGEGYRLAGDRCMALRPPNPEPLPPPKTIPKHREPPVVTITRPPHFSACPWGYVLSDDNRCVDIDECARGTHSCDAEQQCVNAAGGYLCRCPPGHRVSPSGGCEDRDECTETAGRVCSHYATCVNTIGSFRCDCREGFTLAANSQQLCTDIDECAPNGGLGDCHQKCVNVWGAYRCTCDKGFHLHNDNRTCLDVDECSDKNRRLCIGVCNNTPGSYQCTCPKGYRIGTDHRSCIDIDECETGELSCGADQVCQNTRGGARCSSMTCPAGYNREPGSKHRCRRPPGSCASYDTECLRKPDTYSFNFITFVSHLSIPPGPLPQVTLFTMRGPTWPGAMLNFHLRFIEVRAPQGVDEASIECFRLTPSPQQAMVSLVKTLAGPQDIHLELAMDLYTNGNFEGSAVAKLMIYVSEYDF